MRTFVLGDIHGAYKALKQCFQKAKFNHETDQLIFLGDVCDGWLYGTIRHYLNETHQDNNRKITVKILSSQNTFFYVNNSFQNKIPIWKRNLCLVKMLMN